MNNVVNKLLAFTIISAMIASLCVLNVKIVFAADTTVYPTENTTGFIRNPGMGWTLYVDAGNVGDTAPTHARPFQYPAAYWDAQNANAAKASIFYVRAPWSQFEPTEGNYAWNNDSNYQALIQGALDRGLKLAFCVVVNGQDLYQQATPNYVKLAGAAGYDTTAGHNSSVNATVSTTAGAFSGSISNITDSNEASAWASNTGLTFPQYITLDYGSTPITANSFTLVTHYGQGQGITNVDVEYWNGSSWLTAASNVGITWNKNTDAEEARNVSFPSTTATQFRLKVNNANMSWNVFALNELYLWDTSPSVYWSPYVDNSVFRTKFANFLTAFAAKYDNPDQVDYIDGQGLGWWGEMHHIFPDGYAGDASETFAWVDNLYKSKFTKVLLTSTFGGQYDSYAEDSLRLRNLDVGRRDSYGSTIYFPAEAKNRLKTLFNDGYPIIGENVYHGFTKWTTPWSAEYTTLNAALNQVISDAKEVHSNTLDFRVPEDATYWNQSCSALVDDFAINGGYRMVPTSVSFSNMLSSNGAITVKHTWKNTGVGRMPNNRPAWNYKYKVAYALLNKSTGVPVFTMLASNAEPSSWVKGTNYTYTSQAIAGSLTNGDYDFGVAIVDTTKSNTPAINLAITNSKTSTGWNKLGTVTVATNKALTATASTTAGNDGSSISNINDGNDTSAWGSASGVSMPQYVTLDWGASSKTTNKITLVTHYGQGQGITNVDVEYWNGSSWVTAKSNFGVTWNSNTDYEETRDISFTSVTTTKIRLKVNSANWSWSKFALNELKVW